MHRSVAAVAGQPATNILCRAFNQRRQMLNTYHKTRLTLLNLAMFVIHAGFAGVTIAVANTGLAIPLYDTRLEFETEPLGGFRLVPVYIEMPGKLRLTWVVVFFFVCSALGHIGNGWIWREFYFRFLQNAMCPTRWIEYFFSAPAMMVAIAYIAGTRSYLELVSLAGLAATTITFGWMNEVINRPSDRRDAWEMRVLARSQATLLGYVPLCVAWVGVLYTFFSSARRTCGPAHFVYYLVVGEAVLFFSFGLPQLYQVIHPPSEYYVGEYMYQLLSLLAKGFLGMVLLFYVLVHDSFDVGFVTPGDYASGETC